MKRRKISVAITLAAALGALVAGLLVSSGGPVTAGKKWSVTAGKKWTPTTLIANARPKHF